MWKAFLVLFGLLMLTACQNASSRSQDPLSAGSLAEEYERSNVSVRRKYNGKEIIVRGYALLAAATTIQLGDGQGSVFLGEKGREPVRQITCWFSRDQAAEFSKIKSGQNVTVKGVFNGEGGAELKFCKLVRIE